VVQDTDTLYLVNSRYAFRSEEKVALQEIGPRFTLKLRSLRKGLPAVQSFGEAPKKTEIQLGGNEEALEEAQAREGLDAEGAERAVDRAGGLNEDSYREVPAGEGGSDETNGKKNVFKPPTQDEFLWVWKVRRSSSFHGREAIESWHLISPS